MNSLCSGVREEPGRIYYTLSEKQSERQFLKRSSVRVLLVEKTHRLYRNLKDHVTVDELDLEIHFVKENVVVSQDSRSSEKFMHGIKVLMAKNFIDNLSEETKKGMLERPSSRFVRPLRQSAIETSWGPEVIRFQIRVVREDGLRSFSLSKLRISSTEMRMPRMMGLPPKSQVHCYASKKSVSSITVFVLRSSEHFVRWDIVTAGASALRRDSDQD